jgi:chloramphenicol 3-O phosphotransferase
MVKTSMAGEPGNAVIFDDVLHDREMYENRLRAFEGLDVFAVGVVCAIDVLESREQARGDRVVGRARGLIDVVHSFCSYDVIVDTGTTGPAQCVAEIMRALMTRPSEQRDGASPFRIGYQSADAPRAPLHD